MLYLMNTTVVTTDGQYSLRTVSLQEAKSLLANSPWVSAIGHQSTADTMSAVLGVPVEMNRISVSQEVGDSILCFKLNARPPEGVILTQTELEEIGYTWKLLERVS